MGIVLRIFSLFKKQKICYIDFIFTDPEVQGMGFGQKLAEASLNYCEEQGCNEVILQIEGDNTSSSKSFSTRGFTVLSPGQQLRRFGLGIIIIWIRTLYIFFMGHLLWARVKKEKITKHDKPFVQWWVSLLINAFIFMIFALRSESEIGFSLTTYIIALIVCAFFFGIRQISMMIAAKINKFKVRFRPIEDWFTLSFYFASLSGFWIPIPGNLYPKEDTWTYKDNIKKLGPMAFIGALSVLLSSWMIYLIFNYNQITFKPEYMILLDYTVKVGGFLSLLDITLPFFPFRCYNGRRILDWNKLAWVILTIFAIAIFLLAFGFF